MSQTARDRIAEAVEGKPDTVRTVVTGDDGKPRVRETAGLAPVIAGDVVEFVAGLGGRADDTARQLAAGAATVRPEKIVYQRADQLRAVLALGGA